jgi:hypothetical protein
LPILADGYCCLKEFFTDRGTIMRISNYCLRTCGRVALLLTLALSLPGLAMAAQIPEEAKLIASINNGANSGASVSISGNTAVVGAPNDNGGTGAVYVFVRSGGTWNTSPVATLTASDATVGDLFGASVSISGGNIAVGAPGRSSSKGAIYVFSGSGASWTQNGTILTVSTGTAGDKLGSAVSIGGFTVAAGAPFRTVNGRVAAGRAYVFKSNDSGTTWGQSPLGEPNGQTRANNNFGTSVSLSGGTLLVGAPGDKIGNKLLNGAVYVFINNGGAWGRQTRLTGPGVANGLLGAAVALNVNTAVLGAPGSGHAYVYSRSGTTWTIGVTFSGAAADKFGASTAISGTKAIVGAPNANSNGGAVSEYDTTSSTLLNALVATDNAAGDTFGTSVSVDVGRVVVGAPQNLGTGAAYVFLLGPNVSATQILGFVPVGSQGIGQPYTAIPVNTPTGTVTVDDGQGATCQGTLTAGFGSCPLTSTSPGTLTITANYPGDANYLASSGQATYTIIGNHLAFNPDPPANILAGTKAAATVEVRDNTNAVVTADNSTMVTLSTADPCDPNAVATITLGTVQVLAGVATFSGVGQNFYSVTSGFAVSLAANASSTGGTSSQGFDVVANSDFIFAPGDFESCRL